MADPVDILFVSANARALPQLQLDAEFRDVEEMLKRSAYGGTVRLIPVLAARSTDLLKRWLEHDPEVIHFSGHGIAAQGLVFQRADGNQDVLHPQVFLDLIRALQGSVRVVVLNACHSDDLGRSVAEVVGCAIGMDGAIADAQAIVFSAYLYLALGHGRSVRDAFEIGLAALKLGAAADDRVIDRDLVPAGSDPAGGATETSIPRLYCRPGLDPAQLTLCRKPVPRVWPPRAAALALLMSLLAIVGVEANARRARVTLSVPSPAVQDEYLLKATVYRQGRFDRLLDAIPLRQGDEINLAVSVENGLLPSLFWFDTEGKLYRFEFEPAAGGAAGTRRYAWPGPDRYQPLGGPSGTELLLVCATRTGTPSEEAVRDALAGPAPWPELPGDSMLVLERDEVRIVSPRGPSGAPQVRREDAISRTQQLRRELARAFPMFSGVAFPHR